MSEMTQARWSRTSRALLWVAALSLMVMIFCFSAQTGEESSETSGRVVELALRMVMPEYDSMPMEQRQSIFEVTQMTVRKTAHFLEYLLLGLVYRLLNAAYALRRGGWAAWGAGTLYAATDEVHQLFVGERAAAWQDVLLDSAGVAAGVALAALGLWLYGRKRAGKEA